MAADGRWRHTVGTTWRVLLKEISAFGVVGAINVVVDLLVFQLSYVGIGLGPLTSKVVSTSVSTTSSYFMNRHWSFSHRARSGLRREYTLFFLINGVTLLLSLGIVAFVHYGVGLTGALPLQLANLASIGLGTIVRFVAYRRWVFLAPEADQTSQSPVDTQRVAHPARPRREDESGVAVPRYSPCPPQPNLRSTSKTSLPADSSSSDPS